MIMPASPGGLGGNTRSDPILCQRSRTSAFLNEGPGDLVHQCKNPWLIKLSVIFCCFASSHVFLKCPINSCGANTHPGTSIYSISNKPTLSPFSLALCPLSHSFSHKNTCLLTFFPCKRLISLLVATHKGSIAQKPLTPALKYFPRIPR